MKYGILLELTTPDDEYPEECINTERAIYTVFDDLTDARAFYELVSNDSDKFDEMFIEAFGDFDRDLVVDYGMTYIPVVK